MDLAMDVRLLDKLQTETMLWLTTVRRDGMPLPTPVWFLWDGEQFVLFSEPEALKIRNLRHNAQAALNFNTDATGEVFAVFLGQATLDSPPATAAERAAYAEKYRAGMKMIGVTPEEHAQRWSATIRIVPTHIRAQLEEPHE